MKTKLDEQEIKLKEQDLKLSSLEKTVSDQSKKMSGQSKKMSTLEKTLSDQSKKMSGQSKQLSEQSKKLLRQETLINSLKAAQKLEEQERHLKVEEKEFKSVLDVKTENGSTKRSLRSNKRKSESTPTGPEKKKKK
jgi:hypothetical protein